MPVELAKFRKGYDDVTEVRCPHCNEIHFSLSQHSVGLHECNDCGEAFKITDRQSQQNDMEEAMGDLKDEIRWLKNRVEKLEHELGIDE